MSTPAHTQFEEREAVGEGADIHTFAEDEGKQTRGSVQACGQAIGEARMADLLDDVELLQSLCDRHRRSLMHLHADRQGAQTADQKPCVEGRKLAAEIGIGLGLQPRDHLLRACNDAGDHIAMTTEIFGGGMDDEIDAELQRLLEIGGGPAVVDHRDDAMLLGERGQGTDVVRFHDPARRAFHVEDLGARKRLGDGFLVATVDIGHLDLHPLQNGAEEAEGIGIDMLDRNDPVARLDKAQNGRRDRRHAAGETERVLRAFELCQHFLEHAHRRVEAARIDGPHLLAAIGGDHLVIAGEGEQRCLEDRRHHGFGEIAVVMGCDEGCKFERL
ncbi:hypothetical protein RHSP_39106 [Rhizobium freirei PRF 81]|uniref:Uncharacterized protein n=1 Tax=Rhizobium freirei PRF 81 TaxID=363754 RepID=N6U699_9HYPH|nr:hypothetical protein RHSP_39106 [Rhizobium freirei PRF 81]